MDIRYFRRNILNTSLLIILAAVLFASVFAADVFADMGPKPSVRITFTDLPSGTYYATLLGSTVANGPYHAVTEDSYSDDFEETEEYSRNELEQKAYDAFLNYKGADGYYFWGVVDEIRDGGYEWTYYPPDDFRLLVYDTSDGTVYASGPVSTFAFDSYYDAGLQSDGTISVEEMPHITKNLLSFFARVIITILVELLIALAFGYRKKNEIIIITVTNIITQIILNLTLSYIDYRSGLLAWVFIFPVMELIVVGIEAALYAVTLNSHTKKRAVFYALAANVVTAIIGYFVGIYIR